MYAIHVYSPSSLPIFAFVIVYVAEGDFSKDVDPCLNSYSVTPLDEHEQVSTMSSPSSGWLDDPVWPTTTADIDGLSGLSEMKNRNYQSPRKNFFF